MFIIGFIAYVGISIPSIFVDDYALANFALLLAIMAGFMELIPQLGAIVHFVFTVLLAIATGATLPIIIYLVILLLVLQQLEGLVVTPMVMRKAVGLDPLVTILAIIAGFNLGGPIWAILSIPAVVAIKMMVLEVMQIVEERKKVDSD